MSQDLLPRAVKWVFNAAFQGALDESVDRFFARSLENKFERIDDLFAHRLFPGATQGDKDNHRSAHQLAAQEVYSLGKDGYRYLGNLRAILKEPYYETPKGREWAILSIRNQGLDGVAALEDIAKLSTYRNPSYSSVENIGLRQEALQAVGSIGRQAIGSGDERFSSNIHNALPHLVAAFTAIEGSDPDIGTRICAFTVFGELGAVAMKSGNSQLVSLFQDQLPRVVDRINNDGNPVVCAAARDALNMVSPTNSALIGNRVTPSHRTGDYART